MTASLIISAYLIGLAGSIHCIGMCGPMVGLMESSIADAHSPLWRRVAYHVGRLVFYVLLGAGVASIAGVGMNSSWGSGVALTLRFISVIVIAALALQLLRGKKTGGALERIGQQLWQRISPLARFVLPMSTPTKSLAAGMLWGAVPCGMVYSVVTLAATSASALSAAAIMMAFWSGTLPTLLTLGFGAQRVNSPRLRTLTGAALMLVALFSIYTLWPHPTSDADNHAHHATMGHIEHAGMH